MFTYCGNDPVSHVDDSGEFGHILGGALLGAAFGGGFEIIRQLVTGTSFDEIDWGSVIIEAVSGAATGALMSVGGISAPTMALGKAVINGTTSFAHSRHNGDDTVTTVAKVSASVMFATAPGGKQSPKTSSKLMAKLSEKVSKAMSSIGGKVFWDRAKRAGVRTGIGVGAPYVPQVWGQIKTFVTINFLGGQKVESTLSYNSYGEVILLSWKRG